jgi:DNA-binding MurR/RpiR family transcriptional regulator
MAACNTHCVTSSGDDSNDLRARIQARLGDMSPKQRTLARFLLENRSQAVFASASELGAAVDTSAATVVRFAQLLGYEGFLQLRESLRDEVMAFRTFPDQLSDLARQASAADDGLLGRALATERENLAATSRLLDGHSLTALAERIATARRTILIGSGVGSAVVRLVAGHLTRVGLPIVVPADTVDAVSALAHAGPDDVLFGVSFWRFDRTTSEHFRDGRRRGATTGAIVDSPVYPAADDIDHLLVVSSTNAGHGPSVVAACAVANALLSAIILTDFERFSRAIERVEDAYARLHVYLN